MVSFDTVSSGKSIKAVGLLSGGLDSILAVRVLQEQGVEVTALHFRTGFSYEDTRMACRPDKAQPLAARRAADILGVRFEVIDAADDYLPVVLHPRHGYGSGMNPCVDCRIFLLRKAKVWMEEHGHDFVFTGEVVGQRPKSQMKPTLGVVEHESGLRGLLLRPLSAKQLSPTVPELRGWVERDRLCAISGRGRGDQIRLAAEFGIVDYPQPSGGCCFLVDQNYVRRLRDLLCHEGAGALSKAQAHLLSMGRHFRLRSGRKAIVGRNEHENAALEAIVPHDSVVIRILDHPGPVAIVTGTPSPSEVEEAAGIACGYSDGRDAPELRVEVERGDGSQEKITVQPTSIGACRSLMV
jgi:tRNA-specific 2-thiouridylase